MNSACDEPNVINDIDSQQESPTLKTSTASTERSYYPSNFVPRNSDIIIGRGIKNYSHIGNKMLRELVISRLSEYAFATSKKERSGVISSIIEEIHQKGSFIQKDTKTGLWFDADDFLARDKVSQIFRSALYGKGKFEKESKKKQNETKASNSKPNPLESLTFQEIKELVIKNAKCENNKGR